MFGPAIKRRGKKIADLAVQASHRYVRSDTSHHYVRSDTSHRYVRSERFHIAVMEAVTGSQFKGSSPTEWGCWHPGISSGGL